VKVVIVESPAKAKTIEKFLGPGYRVEASYGHIRDLPKSAGEIPKAMRNKPWARMAVDVDNGFKPVYVVPPESQKRVRELRRIVAKAEEIVLATDEDREGEAISWHVLEVLKPKAPIKRIAFHEITRPAIQRALADPREVDHRLVRAQEARRILDRLYGYTLSPVLWRKVRSKLSAGRVQSVALRLVAEREEERRRFKKSVYWRVEAELAAPEGPFSAVLRRIDDAPVATSRHFDATTGERMPGSKAVVLDEQAAQAVREAVLGALPWRVGATETKAVRQRPAPPFTTSTLQQAASSRLRMSPKKAMRIAQRLYEGVDLGGGDREGLITYMRTDSVTLSQKALSDAGRCIKEAFGEEYYDGPRRYRTKSKVAQEAHEAVRPTEMGRTPEMAKRLKLDKDELALYELVWRRAVASQMADARLERATADLEAVADGTTHVFRAVGSMLRFPGFLKVYGTKRSDQLLPPLKEGDRVGPADSAATLAGVEAQPRATRPPARYTEASLVKKLEDEGIGRPSTYTPTISTIQDRDYVRKRDGGLVPTYLGLAVNQLLREHFGEYVDIGFTARMEDALDDIAAGDTESRERFLDAFYNGDGERAGLARAIESRLPGIGFPLIPIGADPATGQEIGVRIGRKSAFAVRGSGAAQKRATIPSDLLIDDLTVEAASELLASRADKDAPLGQDPETGEVVYARVGPYGPYVQLGEARGRKKPRRTSVPDGVDVDAVTLDYALRLLSLPRDLGKDPKTGKPVMAGLGRYGPFVARDGEYRNLDAERLFSVTLDEALELLAKTKRANVLKALGPHPETGEQIEVRSGRYGPYVTDGQRNAPTPRDGRDPETTTLDEAVALLADKAKRRQPAKGKGKGRPRRTAGVRRR